MMTPKELARALVDTVNGPANGWGQYVHPTLGRSDFIQLRLRQEVGDVEYDRLILEAVIERKNQGERT